MSASTERYSAANNLARRLVAEGHSDTVLIKEKQDAMRYVLVIRRLGQSLLLVIMRVNWGDERYLHSYPANTLAIAFHFL